MDHSENREEDGPDAGAGSLLGVVAKGVLAIIAFLLRGKPRREGLHVPSVLGFDPRAPPMAALRTGLSPGLSRG